VPAIADNKDVFVVRPARYHRVISVFFVFSVFGIMNCLHQHTEKYIVGNGYIEKDTFDFFKTFRETDNENKYIL